MDDMTQEAPLPARAGFWRRVLAFLVDGALLGVVGMVLGMAVFDVLAQSGVWGRAVGFAIALAYFGVMNSRLCGGKTLGKRLLKIRTQGIDGNLLTVPRSFARYSVLGVPFFLNNAPFPPDLLMGPAAYLLAPVVFGGLLSIIYLFVFNRKTRRSLHDYAARAWVVADSAPRVPGAVAPLWRGHVAVVVSLFVVAATLPLVAKRLIAIREVASALPAHAAVSATPGVQFAQVMVGWSNVNGVETTYTQVAARLSSPKVEDEGFAKHLARTALAASPNLADRDVVVVELSYGFDIGIASGRRYWNAQFDPKLLD